MNATTEDYKRLISDTASVKLALEIEKILDGAPDPETAATALTVAASRFMSRAPNAQTMGSFMKGLSILVHGIMDLWALRGVVTPALAPWPWPEKVHH